uniref:(northern house mosquito) hypothetical protein n=1 Tax=Culex pipiens TaxID=7175 RepID=A0A8D8GDU3_CULPI
MGHRRSTDHHLEEPGPEPRHHHVLQQRGLHGSSRDQAGRRLAGAVQCTDLQQGRIPVRPHHLPGFLPPRDAAINHDQIRPSAHHRQVRRAGDPQVGRRKQFDLLRR